MLEKVQAFVRRYVAHPDEQELVSSYYVLLSWLYDAFSELPYLGIRGDYWYIDHEQKRWLIRLMLLASIIGRVL